MNYEYEYIKLKTKHEKTKLMYEARIFRLQNEIEDLKNIIIDPISIPKFDLAMNDILTLVSRVTNVLQQHIVSKTREREIVIARCLFSYLCRMHLQKSYPAIARFLNKNHTSIMYHCEAYDNYLKMGYKQETLFYNECIHRINSKEGY